MEANIETIFHGKTYCAEIVDRYNERVSKGFSYVDITWKSSLTQSTDFSTVDSIFNDTHTLIKILGEAGCGKTTLLEQIEYLAAKQFCDGSSALIPVLVPLDHVRLGTSLRIGIEDVICGKLGIDKEGLKVLLQNNALYLLLDGFNKILDLNVRKQIAYSIDSMTRKYPRQKVILTDRALMRPSINTMSSAMAYRRFPMNNGLKKAFIEQNCPDAEAKKLLLSYIENNPPYFENFNLPVRMMQLIELVTAQKTIPSNFDGEYVHFLFMRTLVNYNAEEAEYLEDFACALAIANDTGIPEKAAYACLARCKQILGYTVPDSRKCLKLLIDIGILHNNDGLIDFRHPAYRNYFLMIAYRNDLVNILGDHQ